MSDGTREPRVTRFEFVIDSDGRAYMPGDPEYADLSEGIRRQQEQVREVHQAWSSGWKVGMIVASIAWFVLVMVLVAAHEQHRQYNSARLVTEASDE